MHEKLVADRGASRIEEYAFADFLARGELDRHLRRMRARYRRQRDALVRALAEELPDARVTGIAAGLHVTVQLPGAYDERVIRDEAARRGSALRHHARLPRRRRRADHADARLRPRGRARDDRRRARGRRGAECRRDAPGLSFRERTAPSVCSDAVIGAALSEARARLHTDGLSVRRSAVQLVQTAVAAGIAWVIAQDLIGHGNAFFAPIAAVIVLGIAPGGHRRRAVEVALGVAVGSASPTS